MYKCIRRQTHTHNMYHYCKITIRLRFDVFHLNIAFDSLPIVSPLHPIIVPRYFGALATKFCGFFTNERSVLPPSFSRVVVSNPLKIVIP